MNRCYVRNSQHHLLRKCPQRRRLHTGPVPALLPLIRLRVPAYSPISGESSAEAQDGRLSLQKEAEEPCGELFPATLVLRGGFSADETERVAVLGAGATADLTWFKWPDRHGTSSGDFQFS